MNKMRTFFTTFLLLILSLFMVRAEGNIPPFALITMPKSGSHLLIKTLYFLTGSQAIWHTKFPSYQYIPPAKGFLYTHFCVSPQLEADYKDLLYLKKIILIRDLRDVAISIVHQIRKSPWPGMCEKKRGEFLSMSFDQQLLFVIHFEYDVRAIAKLSPDSLQVSLVRVAEQASEYAENSSILTLRFEDLVGPNGGGTYEAQIMQLKKIREFLSLGVSDFFLYEIAEKIYGDALNPYGNGSFHNFQSTFHVGTIGRWKTAFKEEHKVAFKKKLGKHLIALGYEKNNAW